LQILAIAQAMARICNAADRPKRGCGRREGLVQRCLRPTAESSAPGTTGPGPYPIAGSSAPLENLSPGRLGSARRLGDIALRDDVLSQCNIGLKPSEMHAIDKARRNARKAIKPGMPNFRLGKRLDAAGPWTDANSRSDSDAASKAPWETALQ
jgi:hypothetical protein